MVPHTGSETSSERPSAHPPIEESRGAVSLQNRTLSTMISPCNHRSPDAIVGQVIIRNIDDRVIERLKVRAMAQRKSLEQTLRDLLTEAAKPSRAELLAEAERIRAMTPPPRPGAVYPTAEEMVREDRDTR